MHIQCTLLLADKQIMQIGVGTRHALEWPGGHGHSDGVTTDVPPFPNKENLHRMEGELCVNRLKYLLSHTLCVHTLHNELIYHQLQCNVIYRCWVAKHVTDI